MIGHTISHYRILSKLGEGGMGVVYKAEDTKLRRFVALKFLPHWASDDNAKKRLIHEAQTVSSLDHPNICAIYEIDETADGQMFIAMPSYEGETLQARLQRGPLALEQAVTLAAQLASGLSKAHEKEIIHRDIKPGNIFLTTDGSAKILDFGLAKLSGQTKLTKSGTTPGTVAYMSPEQIKGEDVDCRSDIWSLGVVLYEMISGQPPFRREHDSAAMYSIINLEPDPLEASRKGVPVGLERIVGKCLAKKTDQRYQHADELGVDLQKVKSELETGRSGALSRTDQPSAGRGLKRIWMPPAIIAVITLVFFLLKPILFRDAPVAAPKPIAVISFTNQTGDPSYDYLQEVIPNLLITSLEQSKYLSVVTWERLHDLLVQTGRRDVELIDKEIGFELCAIDGIDTIVLGSYTKAGDVFVTDVKVLDAGTKELLQSASARGDGVGSILQNQIDELGQKISRGVGLSERKVLSTAHPIAEVTTASIEAYNSFLRGRDQYEKLYFADAGKFFENAVELDSTFALAHLYLARTYNALRSVKAANSEYEKAKAFSRKTPEKERLYFEAAYARNVERDTEKHGRILLELVNKYPKEKQARLDLAQYYRWKKLFAEARSECDTALKLDPSFGLAMNEMAYVFVDMKNYEKAVEYFDRYASVSPGEANPFDSMGEMYFRMGRLDDAIGKYEQALEIKTDFGAERWLAYICALKEDYSGAMRWLDQFIAAAPTQGLKAQGYGIKGFYCAWVGKLDESIENHRKGTELFESAGNEAGKGRFAWVKCWAYYEAGDVASCRKSLQDGIDLMAPFISPSARLTMSIYEGATLVLLDVKEARIGSANSRLAGIDSVLRELVRADTTSLDRCRDVFTRVRAEVSLAADSVEKAVNVAENRHSVDAPQLNLADLILYNVPPERDVLARCYQKIGAIDKAIAEYERLVTFDPRSADRRLIYPKFHYRLGRLYEEKGLNAEAAREYKKFLDICGGADRRITEVEDAAKRLRRLATKNSPERVSH